MYRCMISAVSPILSPFRWGPVLTVMEVGRCALWQFLLIQSILKHRFVRACVCVCMLPGVNPSTDPCQPSSHLTLSGNDRRVQSPTVTFLLSHPPQPSDMFRCGYHLPVSRSHVVFSEDLVSQTEELLASGAEGDMYSTMEATRATCGAYSKDWWKQLPYWHNIIVLVFEVHRMRRTHWAMMTGENQPGPE